MLYFAADEIEPQKAGEREKCFLCCDRVGTWKAPLKSKKRGKELVCAYCFLYRPESKWGYENRHQLLHIGRFCRQVAFEYGKVGPALDERGRLCPEDAERLVLGVSVTSKVVSRKMVPHKEDPFTESEECK